MGYKYLKRGICIGFSFTLGMMLLLSGCSGGMEEMQTSQIPENMGSATEVEDVNLVELDSSIVGLEEGLLASLIGRVNTWLGPNGEGLMDAFNPADLHIAAQPMGETSLSDVEQTIE